MKLITLYPVVVVFLIAVKCNDSPTVLSLLAQLGTGFDCASKVSQFMHFIFCCANIQNLGSNLIVTV